MLGIFDPTNDLVNVSDQRRLAKFLDITHVFPEDYGFGHYNLRYYKSDTIESIIKEPRSLFLKYTKGLEQCHTNSLHLITYKLGDKLHDYITVSQMFPELNILPKEIQSDYHDETLLKAFINQSMPKEDLIKAILFKDVTQVQCSGYTGREVRRTWQ